MLRPCIGQRLGADPTLLWQIFNGSGGDSASNLDGVPASLRPFAEAAGNASGTKVESITVRLASFSIPAAAAVAASTAPTELGPVLMGSFATIGTAALFCCIGGALLLLLRRNRRLAKGLAIASATGAGMIMSSNPMLTPAYPYPPSVEYGGSAITGYGTIASRPGVCHAPCALPLCCRPNRRRAYSGRRHRPLLARGERTPTRAWLRCETQCDQGDPRPSCACSAKLKVRRSDSVLPHIRALTH